VQIDLDVRVLPVEAVLLVADVLDGGPGDFLDLLGRNGVGPANLAGNDDTVGRRQRLAGDARQGVAAEEKIDDLVGNAVRNLVGINI
jgi:hypothetical protein